MIHSTSKIQKGIGLIEVLIATVVVAVGLLSVASLQGGLMSSSGESKTRSEARVLAEQKIEELRNNITVIGYNAIPGSATPVSDPSNPIAGANASFTRTWRITGGDAPARKNISVVVGWDGNGDGDTIDADEKVNVVTEMAWIDPAKSLIYAAENSGSGTAAVPSPRQNASEDVASENVIGGAALTIPSGVASGTASSITVTIPPTTAYPSGGTGTLVQVAAGSHFYTLTNNSVVAPGVIAVFLCTTTCTHIQNHFGGVVLRVTGTVYSTRTADRFIGTNPIRVAWTSSEIHACYNGTPVRTPTSGAWQYDSMPYECVFAGNCNATADGVNGCFADTVVSDAQINARNVGPGGEYGEVGLLDVRDSTGAREEVCFLEDTTNGSLIPTTGSTHLNDEYLLPSTKRLYIVRRVERNGSINEQKSEGINRSYTNHNFLVIDRTSNSNDCNSKATAVGFAFQLAPRDIVRTANESGAPNEVVTETSYAGNSGTAQTITGIIASDAAKLGLYIDEIGTCYIKSDSTLYACVVANGVTSAVIKGISQTLPAASPSVFASCTKTSLTTCIWPTNFP
jgi:Tfp pilus assembly protein PilV